MARPTPSLKSTLILQKENLGAGAAVLVPSRLAADDLGKLLAALDETPAGLLVEADALKDSALAAAVEGAGLSHSVLTKNIGDKVSDWLKTGKHVVFVPAPTLTQVSVGLAISRATLEALVALGEPLQPVFVDHPLETRSSVESASSLKDAIIVFGQRLTGAKASLAGLWEEALLAGAVAYAQHPFHGRNLARTLVAGLKKHGGKAKVIEGRTGKETSFHRILAAAIALADEIKNSTTRPRVGVVLPPGTGGLVANLAVVLAGKIPVNLNFTAGKEAIESSIKQSEIDRFLTADEFVRKTQSFPWPPLKNLIFIERVLPKLKGKIIRWLLLVKILPAGMISALLKLSRTGGEQEAVLLFTSGSSGEPKGVVLSHRNLLANVNQFGSRLAAPVGERILACLPLFHSFGCTVTLWYPMIEGISLVTYPTPLDAPKLAELVEKYQVSLLLATPTFLRGYLKRVKREQLASLRLVVTGAEKLPLSLEEEFRKRFGKPVMEGYGLTETSPATNVNLPDPEADPTKPHLAVLPSRRLGSVGQLLPGIALRITHAATDESLPVDQSGMIWLKGPNIFPGYLKQPRKTEEVLKDEWFRTGDIGRLDNEGFLYIEGRLSRFSKIGGEMVPHETVEEHINRALNLEGEGERKIAVVGMPDPDKGEMLVLLSTVASEAVKQELINLRYTLLDRGVPSLWIPKKLVPVPQIPILQSGKLDIKACEKLAGRTD